MSAGLKNGGTYFLNKNLLRNKIKKKKLANSLKIRTHKEF